MSKKWNLPQHSDDISLLYAFVDFKFELFHVYFIILVFDVTKRIWNLCIQADFINERFLSKTFYYIASSMLHMQRATWEGYTTLYESNVILARCYIKKMLHI